MLVPMTQSRPVRPVPERLPIRFQVAVVLPLQHAPAHFCFLGFPLPGRNIPMFGPYLPNSLEHSVWIFVGVITDI